MYGDKDGRCQRVKVKTNSPKRHAYEGNKDPSDKKFLTEGYETLAMDQPSSYDYGDRETIAEDVSYNHRYLRRPF